MASTTIYPYGTDGQLPSSIGVINDLTTGGADKALSAEMGKRLALLAGTYAEAWARSKAITSPFCWLWVETVNGDAISKPIWHKGNSVFVDAAGAIINVTASSVPAAPTITGATSGSTVPKNTQITITPESGSALYYSIDGGTTYNVSDASVKIKLETAGSVSIVAYCANNAGNSSNATLSVTVAGTAVPTFSPNGGEVARGGSVTISVPAGGELHYKIDSGSWITASGTSVSIPITGETTIQAYNIKDGDTSSTITKSFTMAALASPTFSVATGTEFPATGGSVELTGPTGATIYYTTDGSTPTTSSTQYTGTAIAVASAMTIKAIAHDNYGSSAVAEASYTVAVDHKFQFKIKLTGDNSTEYVPVVSGKSYNFSVDWGDGDSEVVSGVKMAKSVSHTYSGTAGDIKTITLRDTSGDNSGIPRLNFDSSVQFNMASLYSIDENTLQCITFFGADTDGNSFSGCTNLTSMSENALQNAQTKKFVSFNGCNNLGNLPDGIFQDFAFTIRPNFTSCTSMTALPSSLKHALSTLTDAHAMFFGCTGLTNAGIPSDLFDEMTDASVTSFNQTFRNCTGLQSVLGIQQKLATKATSSCNTAQCFMGCSGASDLSDVPSSWK